MCVCVQHGSWAFSSCADIYMCDGGCAHEPFWCVTIMFYNNYIQIHVYKKKRLVILLCHIYTYKKSATYKYT